MMRKAKTIAGKRSNAGINREQIFAVYSLLFAGKRRHRSAIGACFCTFTRYLSKPRIIIFLFIARGGFTMALLTQSLQKFLLGSVLLLASSLPPHLAQAADAQPRVVDVKQGKSMAERGALLLDVRELEEYQQGHAPNSRLLPLGQLNKRIAELDAYRDKPIAVICRSGRRSAQAVELLRQAGFTQVVNVQGGMNAWEAAALPVVKGKN